MRMRRSHGVVCCYAVIGTLPTLYLRSTYAALSSAHPHPLRGQRWPALSRIGSRAGFLRADHCDPSCSQHTFITEASSAPACFWRKA
ncbi:hypothetical protein F4861DRAFT_229329 [Xylaria intraflava]|nr:hypothetical protein F4861DRAFT_229329 [Xylaria intraflava]